MGKGVRAEAKAKARATRALTPPSKVVSTVVTTTTTFFNFALHAQCTPFRTTPSTGPRAAVPAIVLLLAPCPPNY